MSLKNASTSSPKTPEVSIAIRRKHTVHIYMHMHTRKKSVPRCNASYVVDGEEIPYVQVPGLRGG